MELLTRNSETINSNNKSKIPEQLIKAHQQFASGRRYVNNLLVNSDSNKNENIDNKVHKENLELSTLKFYKEVEQSMNAKLNQNLDSYILFKFFWFFICKGL
jgi:replication-associated recombination protein RarA